MTAPHPERSDEKPPTQVKFRLVADDFTAFTVALATMGLKQQTAMAILARALGAGLITKDDLLELEAKLAEEQTQD